MKTKIICGVSLILNCIFIGILMHYSTLKNPTIGDVECDLFSQDTTGVKLTEGNLIQYMNDVNVKFPEVVLTQALIESGNLTSGLCLKGNNLFGMRPSTGRPNAQIKGKEYKGYAMYETWQLSVLDYMLWQYHTGANKHSTRSDYVMVGLRNYAVDSTYRSVILEKSNQYASKF